MQTHLQKNLFYPVIEQYFAPHDEAIPALVTQLGTWNEVDDKPAQCLKWLGMDSFQEMEDFIEAYYAQFAPEGEENLSIWETEGLIKALIGLIAKAYSQGASTAALESCLWLASPTEIRQITEAVDQAVLQNGTASLKTLTTNTTFTFAIRQWMQEKGYLARPEELAQSDQAIPNAHHEHAYLRVDAPHSVEQDMSQTADPSWSGWVWIKFLATAAPPILVLGWLAKRRLGHLHQQVGAALLNVQAADAQPADAPTLYAGIPPTSEDTPPPTDQFESGMPKTLKLPESFSFTIKAQENGTFKILGSAVEWVPTNSAQSIQQVRDRKTKRIHLVDINNPDHCLPHDNGALKCTVSRAEQASMGLGALAPWLIEYLGSEITLRTSLMDRAEQCGIHIDWQRRADKDLVHRLTAMVFYKTSPTVLLPVLLSLLTRNELLRQAAHFGSDLIQFGEQAWAWLPIALLQTLVPDSSAKQHALLALRSAIQLIMAWRQEYPLLIAATLMLPYLPALLEHLGVSVTYGISQMLNALPTLPCAPPENSERIKQQDMELKRAHQRVKQGQARWGKAGNHAYNSASRFFNKHLVPVYESFQTARQTVSLEKLFRAARRAF